MSVQSETNDGFIVGVDPRQARIPIDQMPVNDSEVGQSRAADQQQVPDDGQPIIITDDRQSPPQENGATAPSRIFDEDDVARIRTEEKEKLYGRLSAQDEELKALRQEREERVKAEKAAIAAQEAVVKAKEEEEMELRDLLDRREQEWEQKFNGLQGQWETDKAVFEQERRFQSLMEYRRDLVEANADSIMPELRDLVTGNTEEEILRSVEQMQQRTSAIMQNVSDGVAAQRQTMRGSAPTSPPVGPMENEEANLSLTPEKIAAMDQSTYARYRERLLQAAGQAYRQGG